MMTFLFVLGLEWKGKSWRPAPLLSTPFAFLRHLMTGTPRSGHRGPQDIPMLLQGGLNRNKTPPRLHFDTGIIYDCIRHHVFICPIF